MPRKSFIFFFYFIILLTVGPFLNGQTVWEWNPPGGPGTGNTQWSDLSANWTKTSGTGTSLPGSRLEWKGYGDLFGTNNLSGLSLQRISFFGLQSYSLSGNQLTLSDATPGAQGMVYCESTVSQALLIPIIFDDNAKEAIITTQSTGRLGLSSITLGSNITRLSIYGENIEGVITIGDALSGSKPVFIGNLGAAPKANTRVVFLGNNASFTGSLSVTGVLNVQNNAALGTSAGSPATVAIGSAIEVSGGISLSGRNIAINGTGVGSTGAIRSVLGNNTIVSGILLSGNSRIGNDATTSSLTLNKIGRDISSTLSGLTFSGTGSIILNDTVGNPADPLNGNFAKVGTGTLTIRKPCYYNGGTNINTGGVLVLADNNVLPVTGLTLNSGTIRASTAANTTGYSQAFKRLTFSNNATIALGTGDHSFSFDSAAVASSGKLTITGWKGNPGESGTAGFGKIYFYGDGGANKGLTDAQLTQISFAGYCDGATLLPTGELVPALKPFIQNVTSANAPASVTGFSGFVGATITIAGCLFNGANKVEIGSTTLLPPNFTLVDSTKITFSLGDKVEGLIKITTPNGERTNPTPLLNLGYITNATGAWSVGSTWLGAVKPPADRPVSINNSNVQVDEIVNILNTADPPVNPLTLYPGSAGNAYLRMGAANRLPANTPLVLVGGALRLYNSSANGSPPTGSAGNGYDQSFSTLTLKGDATIAFGNTTNLHTIRFSASNLVVWTSGTKLTILNWDGVPGSSSGGTKTRIFVGTDATGLTADQLRQVQFGTLCQGAKILSTGELVPAEAPFISTVVSDPTPGAAFQAYYGAKVTITGCKMDSVNSVKVGSTNVTPFTLVGSNSIEFIYSEGLPIDRITLSTSEIPAKEGFSGSALTPAGYATAQNGNWSNATTWLSSYSPVAGSKVIVRTELGLTADVVAQIDSVVVNNGAKLVLKDNGLLTIAKNLVNYGTVSATGNGRIIMLDGGIITNNASFNMNGFGTVNFLGSGAINGTIGSTFNNLWINSGILTLPNTTTGTIKTSLVPWIMGEFRINGGSILATNGTASSTYGPRYGSGGSLVYASGATQRRGREWYAPPVDSNAAFPKNITVENGTTLILDGGPSISSTNLVCGGNFTIRSGTVRVDLAKPLEIQGNLQIGENSSSFAVMNVGRISSEVDATTPTTLINNVNNYVLVGGNLIVYPNSSYNVRQNTQPFHFTGSSTSYFEVPGSTASATTPAMSLNYIHVERNGYVILKSSLQVTDSITFTNGIIQTEPGAYIRLAAGAKLKGGSQNSFVAGRLEKVTASSPANASGDFTFHVGKVEGATVYYRPVKVANLTHSGSTTYSAEFFTSQTNSPPFDPGPGFADATLVGVWKKQWWEVSRTGSGQGRVGIPYSPGSEWTSNPGTNANVGVVRYSGSSWEFTETPGNFDNSSQPYPEARKSDSSGWIYSDLLPNFSPFTVGWGQAGVLPLSLLYFRANLAGNDVQLTWKIADSKDLRYFVVEHSLDGRNFQEQGKVLWEENKEYRWKHIAPGSGVHFYRLQMVEKSGAKSFSPVEMVQIGVNQTVIEGLVQNPVIAGVAMVKVYSALSQKAEASVYDLSGRLVFRQHFNLAPGKNNSPINLLPLAAGQYRMMVRTMDGVEKQLPLFR